MLGKVVVQIRRETLSGLTAGHMREDAERPWTVVQGLSMGYERRKGWLLRGIRWFSILIERVDHVFIFSTAYKPPHSAFDFSHVHTQLCIDLRWQRILTKAFLENTISSYSMYIQNQLRLDQPFCSSYLYTLGSCLTRNFKCHCCQGQGNIQYHSDMGV